MSKDLTARQLAEALGIMIESSLKEQKAISDKIHLQSQDFAKQLSEAKSFKIDVTDMQKALEVYKKETSIIENSLKKTCRDILDEGRKPSWTSVFCTIIGATIAISFSIFIIISNFKKEEEIKLVKQHNKVLLDFVRKDDKTMSEYDKFIKSYTK